MIDIIISINTGVLTSAQLAVVEENSVSWTIIHDTGTRQHVDAMILSLDVVPALEGLLVDRNPIIIGAWDYNTGKQVMPFDATEYLSVCPGVAQDVVIGSDEFNEDITSKYNDDGTARLIGPPTVPVDIHRPAGMGRRDMN